MDLINQLKKEHIELLRLFEDLENLRILKEILTSHLDLEDKLLYPALVTAGGDVRELGGKFSEEMKKISNVALVFFGKYITKNISELKEDAEFKKELEEIIKVVKKRIKLEEEILFPAYEKCCTIVEGDKKWK